MPGWGIDHGLFVGESRHLHAARPVAEKRWHARPSILRNVFGFWCSSRGVMSRGLEARRGELARLCLSVGRIGRCECSVVVNPVSSPRSALAANCWLGQPFRPSRLLHVPTSGPSKLRNVSSLAESRRQETEALAQCTPEAASPSSTFIFESSTSSGILFSREHELYLFDSSCRGH